MGIPVFTASLSWFSGVLLSPRPLVTVHGDSGWGLGWGRRAVTGLDGTVLSRPSQQVAGLDPGKWAKEGWDPGISRGGT